MLTSTHRSGLRNTVSTALLAIVLAATAPAAMAIGLVVTGSEMQTLMKPFLPYRMAFGEWSMALTNPRPEFAPEGQKIAMGFDMQLTQGATAGANKAPQKMTANAKIGGQLYYDATAKQVQLVKPTLLGFEVKDGDSGAFEPVIRQLKNNLGQQIPIIVLVDAKHLGPGINIIAPRAITVVQNGLSIDF